MLEHGELVGDFCPAQDGDERPLWIVEEPRERGLLALEEQPGIGRQEVRHTDGRGMRAVSGPERVVDEEVTEPGQAGGEMRVVDLFAGLETRVFEQKDI